MNEMDQGYQGYPVTEETPIKKSKGAYLPHWTAKGGIYHVRFRLADSLPESIRRELSSEKIRLLALTDNSKDILTRYDRKRLVVLWSEKMEKALDAGYGSCVLKSDSLASIVAEAITFFEGERYRLYSWCIMPNHVHVVAQPLGEFALSQIIHTWKSFTAKRCNAQLGRSGEFWQKESYDHLVRDDDDLRHCIDYVYLNSEKAGLMDWKWRWKAV